MSWSVPSASSMVAPLPANFVARPVQYGAIVTAVLDRSTAGPVGITAALRGAGGYGKTTLAQAVCCDPRVQAAFPDGILWVTLGNHLSGTTCVSKICDLCEFVEGERPGFTDPAIAAAHFREIMWGRQALLVIDDVWRSGDLQYFLQPGAQTVCLITTRNDDTLPGGTKKIIVDAMQTAEAVQLVQQSITAAADDPRLRPLLEDLVRWLGECPLLVNLANAILRSRVERGESLTAAAEFVYRALQRKGLRAFDLVDSIRAMLGVSIGLLTDFERQRFAELAVFPEDIDIPLAALETLWGFARSFDGFEVEELCTRLADHALLLRFDLSNRTIRLHDVIRRYLLEEQGPRVTGLQEALLEAYGRKCPGGWHTGPRDGYFFRFLAYHLAQAGQADELEKLLLDFDWIDAHLRSGGINELLGDYKYIPAAPPEAQPRLALVQATLRLSAHVLSQDPDQLAAQLLGRLLDLPSAESLPLLAQARGWRARPWLRPLFPCYNPPGGFELRTLSGHADVVFALAVSPDGRLAVSASFDKTLKVWDLASAQELRTLKGHSDWVYAVAISQDGRRAVSASWDKTVKVWDLESGKELRTLSGHSGFVLSVAISPDGQQAVSASWDGTLKVWDLASGKELRTLRGHFDSVNVVAISPDGRLVVSGSADTTLKVWDLSSGQELRTLRGHSDWVYSVAISPDGHYAVSASWDNTLKVWDLDNGQELRTLRGHNGPVHAVAISPDGRRAVSGSEDATLKVWDLDCGQEVAANAAVLTLRGHLKEVNAVAISPDGRLVVSASGDEMVKLWDLASGQDLRTLRVHANRVSAVAISPDGRCAVSASSDHTLKVWDLDSGRERRTLRGHPSEVQAAAANPDGWLGLSGFGYVTGKTWALAGSQEPKAARKETQDSGVMAVSPDGRLAVVAAEDFTLQVVDLAASTTVRTLHGHTAEVNAVAISPDSRLAVSASADQTLKVWNLIGGQEEVAESRDSAESLDSAESTNSALTLSGHTGAVTAVTISPDGRRVLSGSTDGTLKMWDLASGDCPVTFICEGQVIACAVSLDGRTIVAGDNVGRLYFLRLEEARTAGGQEI